MSEAGAKPEETVMIGDSQVDVETARKPEPGRWAAPSPCATEAWRQPARCDRGFAGGLDSGVSAAKTNPR